MKHRIIQGRQLSALPVRLLFVMAATSLVQAYKNYPMWNGHAQSMLYKLPIRNGQHYSIILDLCDTKAYAFIHMIKGSNQKTDFNAIGEIASAVYMSVGRYRRRLASGNCGQNIQTHPKKHRSHIVKVSYLT